MAKKYTLQADTGYFQSGGLADPETYLENVVKAIIRNMRLAGVQHEQQKFEFLEAVVQQCHKMKFTEVAKLYKRRGGLLP